MARLERLFHTYRALAAAWRGATRFPKWSHLRAAAGTGKVLRNAEESMAKKIAFVGAGAVGGYTGAHMVQAGGDVTFIDPWPGQVGNMLQHCLRGHHTM